MADELGFFDVSKTGSTIDFYVLDATGRIRDVVAGAWDTYTDADVDDYNVVATEQGTSSGLFLADFPSGISAGVYYFVAKERAGGSPAVSDDEVGKVTPIHWDGSAEVPLSTILADTNELQSDDVPGLIAALNDLAQSDILSDGTPFAGANIDAAISSRQPSGNVDLNADQSGVTIGTVNALAAAAITAAVVDTDVFDADALATDAVNEIRDAITAAINDLTAAEVWAYATRTLTQSAASVMAAVVGEKITVYRGTTWSVSLTGLGSLSNYDTIFLSVKEAEHDSDDDAILRVYNDASGLQRFNKAAPAAAGNGSITIDDAANGDITITVDEAETDGAPIKSDLYYDIKGIDNDGNVDLISVSDVDNDKGWNIEADITRAITSP